MTDDQQKVRHVTRAFFSLSRILWWRHSIGVNICQQLTRALMIFGCSRRRVLSSSEWRGPGWWSEKFQVCSARRFFDFDFFFCWEGSYRAWFFIMDVFKIKSSNFRDNDRVWWIGVVFHINIQNKYKINLKFGKYTWKLHFKKICKY